MDADGLIAKARAHEAQVKEVFDKYDVDSSGSIDDEEMLAVLGELGLLQALRTNQVEFLTQCFVDHDIEGKGAFSFEEFKNFYNRAKDDARGSVRRPANARKGLSAEGTKAVEAKMRRKAQHAEKALTVEGTPEARREARKVRMEEARQQTEKDLLKEEEERKREEEDAATGDPDAPGEAAAAAGEGLKELRDQASRTTDEISEMHAQVEQILALMPKLKVGGKKGGPMSYR